MDRILQRELAAIARDNRSGAAELALRAVRALAAWEQRAKSVSPRQLLACADAVQKARSHMAPFWRLAGALRRIARRHPRTSIRAFCNKTECRIATASRRIAERFAAALSPGKRTEVLTYSYSSTVLRALVQARRRIGRVYCSECSPEREGRKMARRLARAGVRVTFVTDACLPLYIQEPRRGRARLLVVTGADAVLPDCYLNRSGTETLLARAAEARVPFWILADTMKFVPRQFPHGAAGYEPWRDRVWPGHPRGVEVHNVILSAARYRTGVRFLTERGWMTLKQVRAAVAHPIDFLD